MVGNDIVDLFSAKLESNWQRKGFLEKQFTKAEQDVIVSAQHPFLTVWRMWSMKEAAYKIIMQSRTERFFAPKKLKCTIISNKRGVVSFESQTFFTETISNTEFIHTIALDKESKKRISSFVGSALSIENEIKNHLFEETRILRSEIRKQKSAVGAPNYFYQEKQLTDSCSISHHGNYNSFAFILNNEY